MVPGNRNDRFEVKRKMKCPECGEEMIMVKGCLICPVCDDIELNKTLDAEHWIQGNNDDNSQNE